MDSVLISKQNMTSRLKKRTKTILRNQKEAKRNFLKKRNKKRNNKSLLIKGLDLFMKKRGREDNMIVKKNKENIHY